MNNKLPTVSLGLFASVFALAAFLPLTAIADGVVTTTVSATAPADTGVIIKNDTISEGGFGWDGRPPSRRNTGQTFTVEETFTLDQIVLRVATNFVDTAALAALANADFHISLYQFDSATSAAPSTGKASLFNAAGKLPATGITTGIYLNFDVPDTLLAKGFVYGFVLSFDNLTADQRVNLAYKSGGNAYIGGSIVYTTDTSGSTYTVNTSNDLNFYLVGSTIPEPSTYALILGLIIVPLLTFRCLFTRRH
ncbi:hypothetical protein Ga0100231_001605 [Opitutaceae bacterium TAV4]|nr:hypothetical protein Ga0100230_007745 [Opitutaceae bacterium TAV3]RRK01514.1 hypothetical protein Ga0100231_001605 [Opitutaceae bacterium TAV4]